MGWSNTTKKQNQQKGTRPASALPRSRLSESLAIPFPFLAKLPEATTRAIRAQASACACALRKWVIPQYGARFAGTADTVATYSKSLARVPPDSVWFFCFFSGGGACVRQICRTKKISSSRAEQRGACPPTSPHGHITAFKSYKKRTTARIFCARCLCVFVSAKNKRSCACFSAIAEA